AWIHFGANIGASAPLVTRLAASDDDFDKAVADAIASAGATVDQRNPRGSLPGGEAELVHRGGGRYVALTGGNALFHNPDDRGPQVVNVAAIARIAAAFVSIVKALSATAACRVLGSLPARLGPALPARVRIRRRLPHA